MRDRLRCPGLRCSGLFRRAIAVFFVSVVHASAALAFQPLITDDTGTQGAGGNQIEFALNRQELKSAGDTTKTRTLPLVYTRGLADTLDAYVGVSHVRIRSSIAGSDAKGGGNPVLGLKWRFYHNEERKLSIGFKPELQIGVSNDAVARGLGIDRNSYSGLIIATQETGFGAVHFNVGRSQMNYGLDANRNANRHAIHRLSVAPVFGVAEGWKVAVDLGVTTNPDRTRRARMGYAELGAIWSPGKDLDFALGWIANLADGEPRSFTWTAGVTWRFK